jgi:hypothetical protein
MWGNPRRNVRTLIVFPKLRKRIVGRVIVKEVRNNPHLEHTFPGRAHPKLTERQVFGKGLQ